MSLQEVQGRIEMATAAQLILVLDASESAASHRAQITKLAQDVLNLVPAWRVRSLYFLGHATAYEPGHLAYRVTQWFQENQSRVSLIAPVFEQLQDPGDLRIVIIGAGRIFDLEDWEGTLLLQHTLLASVGDSLQVRAVAEEHRQPEATGICRWLDDPVVCVQLSGTGFMPTAWDNRDYHLTFSEDCAVLLGEQAHDYSLTVLFFHDPTEAPVALVTRVSGARDLVPIATAPPGKLPEQTTGWLEAAEVAAFERAVQHQSFPCPITPGVSCRWDELYCSCSEGFEHPVYSFLERHQAEGFVLFRRKGQRVSYQLCGHGVLRLGARHVAMKAPGSKPALYTYDDAARRWQKTSQAFEWYHRIGAEAYAIFV